MFAEAQIETHSRSLKGVLANGGFKVDGVDLLLGESVALPVLLAPGLDLAPAQSATGIDNHAILSPDVRHLVVVPLHLVDVHLQPRERRQGLLA